MEKIDFVLPWVDGNDLEWQAQKEKYYQGEKNQNKSSAYRDWDTLRFWFRGIEKFTPWVNKIHFVTWGHIPPWLNVNHPKLNIVRHSDFIPADCLPTFSANSIELNINKIKNLEEHFVYFNDDTFVMAPMIKEDFFINGLPTDSAILSATIPSVKNEIFTYILFNDLLLINSNFERRVLDKHKKKWFSLKYGKRIIKNCYYWPLKKIPGFENFHLPNAFLKSVLDEVWEKEHQVLSDTIHRRFRTPLDVNQYVFRYWQLVTGRFSPRRIDIGRCFVIGQDNDEIKNCILNQSYKLLCLNDDPNESINFEHEKTQIKEWFARVLPEPSSFELSNI